MREKSKSDAVKDFAKQVVDGAGTAVTLSQEVAGQGLGIGIDTVARAADAAKNAADVARDAAEEYFNRVKGLAVDMGATVLGPLVEGAAKLKADADFRKRWIDGEPALGDRPLEPNEK